MLTKMIPTSVVGVARRERSRLIAGLCALLLVACSAPQDEAASTPAEPQEFAFTGTVERVDAAAGIVSVRNDDIPGWMMSMTMNYVLDRPAMVDSLAVGDRINATVYEGDFVTLHRVEVVRPQ
jgi:Cu/Ag efflux protein CusF